MRPAGSEGAIRVQAILGEAFRVLEFEQSTHSSSEAAAAIGCEVAQIAKSMLFRAADGRPVLVVASGVNRVDEKKVAALIGQKIKRAEADFVLAHTGTAPGGVAPVGHVTPAGDGAGPGSGSIFGNLGGGWVAERGVRADAGGPGAADRGGICRCSEISRRSGTAYRRVLGDAASVRPPNGLVRRAMDMDIVPARMTSSSQTASPRPAAGNRAAPLVQRRLASG